MHIMVPCYVLNVRLGDAMISLSSVDSKHHIPHVAAEQIFCVLIKTRSSADAEGPRDAFCHLQQQK